VADDSGTKKDIRALGVIVVALMLIPIVAVMLLDIESPLEEPPATPEVIFDNTHMQAWSVWDTSAIGYSEAAVLLREQGYSVSENTLPLTELLPELGKGVTLVLGVAFYQSYSEVEVEAVLGFVERGGGLFIIGEHNNFRGCSDYQNQLAEEFGMYINAIIVRDDPPPPQFLDEYEILVSSDYFGLSEMKLYGAGSITISAPAQSMAIASGNATPQSAVMVGGAEYGMGRVVCVADANFLWNGNDTEGINFGDNQAFLLETIVYLSGPDTNSNALIPEYGLFTANEFNLTVFASEVVDIRAEIKGGTVSPTSIADAQGNTAWKITVENDGYVNFIHGAKVSTVYFLSPGPDNGNKSVLFDTSHHTRPLDDSESGLLDFSKNMRDNGLLVHAGPDKNYSGYEAVFIVNPLTTYDTEDIERFSTPGKILLFGEGMFSLESEYWGQYDEYREIGYLPLPSPINQIGASHSLNFTWHRLVDKNNNSSGNPLFPTVRMPSGNLSLYSAQVVAGGENYDATAKGREGSWGELLAWEGHVENGLYDIDTVTVGLTSDRIYAFGDTTPLTNAHFNDNKWLGAEIASWIIS
jgi:hypothetical protein